MQFEYNKQSHNTIYGGTIDATPIGSTTPAAGYFTPAISKGPAIITAFAGTISSEGEVSSTTINFSSAADAILAGYNATNPVLGTTLIAANSTRYILSWTDADTCVVDTAVDWNLLTAITSVQLPIATFVSSAGVTQGWMNAAGNVYFVQNAGIGTTLPDGQLSQGLGNGQQISYKSLTELTTIAAAATTTTTIAIPANVIVKAVSVRVTVLIPTAATFTVIGDTSTTAFNTAAVPVAAGSTDKGNLNCPYNNGVAQTIRITPSATPADTTGRVRVTIWYEDSIPATS